MKKTYPCLKANNLSIDERVGVMREQRICKRKVQLGKHSSFIHVEEYELMQMPFFRIISRWSRVLLALDHASLIYFDHFYPAFPKRHQSILQRWIQVEQYLNSINIDSIHSKQYELKPMAQRQTLANMAQQKAFSAIGIRKEMVTVQSLCKNSKLGGYHWGSPVSSTCGLDIC